MNVGSKSVIFFVAMLLLTTLALLASSTNLIDSAEYRDWQEFKEFQDFKAWRRSLRAPRRSYLDIFLENKARRTEPSGMNSGKYNEPPPIDRAARMARYIVNQANWTSVATVSSRKDTQNYPFVNIISFSDGPLGSGSGIPYLFLTPLDYTAQDVFKDNRATLMMSLVQGNYCAEKGYDPMDPRCARVVITGKIKAIKEDNPEFSIAQKAVFGRHPWLAHMPEDHHFFFAKLKIGTIDVLDTFGGPKHVSVEDYMNSHS